MLIPIGRFSKMTRLSVKALRIYDEQGLLKPANVDAQSGYRSYRLDQAQQADIIKSLRGVDMPLEEIRLFLETDDTALAKQQLKQHQERLTVQVIAQQRMLSYLESIIQRDGKIDAYEIQVNETDPQLVAAVKFHTSLQQAPTDISSGFMRFAQGLLRTRAITTGPPMLLYHQVIDQESDGYIEICAPIKKATPADPEIYHRQLGGGTVATTIHRGPYEGIAPAYHNLTHWVSENGYEIASATREIYVSDPALVAAQELITRVEFPIVKDSIPKP